MGWNLRDIRMTWQHTRTEIKDDERLFAVSKFPTRNYDDALKGYDPCKFKISGIARTSRMGWELDFQVGVDAETGALTLARTSTV